MKTRAPITPFSENAIARVQAIVIIAFLVVVAVGGYYILSIIVPSKNQTPSSPSETPNLGPTPLIDIAMVVSAGPGGTIQPGSYYFVQSGDSITYTITPNPGYQISNVIVDGISQGAITKYKFTNIQTNHEISASFTPVPTSTPTPTALSSRSQNAWVH